VSVDGETIGSIGQGFVVLLGVGKADTDADASYMADKVIDLRVCEDENGKMNRSLLDAGGAMLAISQFTLYGDARGQRRPSFIEAAPPDEGLRLFELFVEKARERGVRIETGRFGAHMIVEIENDGPVTVLLDSEKTF
jgi:D-tyrosyl-tRNA(Tyr) deacylase